MCVPPAKIVATNEQILRPGRDPPTRPTRRTVAFTNDFETEPDHQRGRHDQPRVRDQRLVVEGHLEPVDRVRYSTHRKCLLELATATTSNTVIVPAQEALSADTRTRSAATHRWIEANPLLPSRPCISAAPDFTFTTTPPPRPHRLPEPLDQHQRRRDVDHEAPLPLIAHAGRGDVRAAVGRDHVVDVPASQTNGRWWGARGLREYRSSTPSATA